MKRRCFVLFVALSVISSRDCEWGVLSADRVSSIGTELWVSSLNKREESIVHASCRSLWWIITSHSRATLHIRQQKWTKQGLNEYNKNRRAALAPIDTDLPAASA